MSRECEFELDLLMPGQIKCKVCGYTKKGTLDIKTHRNCPEKRIVSGYGVPRADFTHTPAMPKKEVPTDLPLSVTNWLEEKEK